MNGEMFVEILSNEFGISLGPSTKTQWRAKAQISPTILRNALRALERQKVSCAIKPIVEFHPLNFFHESNIDSLARRIDDKTIVERLKQKVGIYAFYATGGRLVYVGKTEKNNLLSEMSQRHGNKKVPFRILKNGKSCDAHAYIKHVAEFISAYEVDKHLITNVEALLTRIMINNASNIRIENLVGIGR